MPAKLLTKGELSIFLAECPDDLRGLVIALRGVVRRCAPAAAEAIRFNCLCYFHAGAPFGSIGGNICMIESGRKGVRLSFIQGARIPDPKGLLQGPGKAKRHVQIRAAADIRDPGVRALIRASAARAAAG